MPALYLPIFTPRNMRKRITEQAQAAYERMLALLAAGLAMRTVQVGFEGVGVCLTLKVECG